MIRPVVSQRSPLSQLAALRLGSGPLTENPAFDLLSVSAAAIVRINQNLSRLERSKCWPGGVPEDSPLVPVSGDGNV